MEFDPSYTYLALNIGTLLGPFVLSFDKKVAFWKEWGAILPGLLFTAFVFIVWDVWFTDMGVWSFNPDYLVGIYFLGLPLEEWLFFFTVPYACVFIYACWRAYVPRDYWKSVSRQIAWGVVAFSLVLGLIMWDHWYTAVTCLLLALWMTLSLTVLRFSHFGHFFQAYLISIVPFFMVNGVLTALPVVAYNDLENLGFRFGTIPADDTLYCMLLLLMNITIYEAVKERRSRVILSTNQHYVQP